MSDKCQTDSSLKRQSLHTFAGKNSEAYEEITFFTSVDGRVDHHGTE